MKNFKKILSAVSALALSATSMATAVPFSVQAEPVLSDEISYSSGVDILASSASVSVIEASGAEESAYVKWGAVTGATGYNVYCDGKQIDSMLIRQYADCFRADAVGIKAGTHTLKIVPVINGKEDASKAAEKSVISTSYDRTGFGWVSGTSSGAYNEDGTLRDGAVVLYVTEDTKNTVSLDVVTDGKGKTVSATGIQNILTAYKKGYDSRPLDIRIIGEVTDPAALEGGDLLIKGNSDTKRLSCGITIEGIGEDATVNGFGIRLANVSNVEIRNLGVMLVDSGEGDNYTLQQSCDHVWVHNCDSFYGMAGGDADQAKGDGALDCKKSTYITFSYNHFWDNGKCNLLGLSEDTTEGLYITYHHNWYDHSDSRHPRVRFYSAHVYNNYYDGNAKYGIGSTNGSSVFSENNYFRNCKYPMLTSMQGSDVGAGGIFSSEDGGTIKSFGNYMEGQKAYVPYQNDSTDFDAYEASSKDEKVPDSVKSKQGGNTYNNFDTSSTMYSYTADNAADVPSIVTSKAGRLNGGDFKYTFDNSVDDASYSVNQALMSALKSYKSSVIKIGSGFTDNTDPVQPTEPVATTAVTTAKPNVTTATTVKTEAKTTVSSAKATVPVIVSGDIIYCSPNGNGDGKTKETPTDVLSAISSVKAGGTIYLLGGTYKFSETILIDQNNSGTESAYKTISAYPGENVVWDFSGQKTDGASRGVVLDGSYWHWYGFEITKAGDNGMLLSGNSNKIEKMVFNDNQDTGLQLSRYRTDATDIADWPTNNLIINCTSKNNCDDLTMENADGFAAKLTCGEGNVFDGCLSYNNSDDGWDLFAKEATGPIGVVTIQNCVAFRNGFTEFGEGYGDCDGNGFKLGGSGIGSAHIVKNCLAFENLHCGFTDNNNPKLGKLINCTAVNNNGEGKGKPNFSCYRCTDPGADFDNLMSIYNSEVFISDAKLKGGASNDKYVGTYANGVYYNSGYYRVDEDTAIKNGAKIGTKYEGPKASDFISMTKAPAQGTDFHTAWRNADGSLNLGGLYETVKDGEYGTMGYHFEKSETPVVTTATTVSTTTTTTVTTAKPSEPTEPATTVETKASTTVTTEEVKPTTTVTTVVNPSEAPTSSEVANLRYGDVNLDEKISVADAVLLNKYLVNSATLTEQSLANADCYKNGTPDANDTLTILKVIVGTYTESDLPILPE
ncbi:MAG: right-handed parallel beta-helix repeat-containing protein [Ruminococcus callidus]|nr:right-handed parallel beta-helix repeat-containing protein [Ruminococcus callidus]